MNVLIGICLVILTLESTIILILAIVYILRLGRIVNRIESELGSLGWVKYIVGGILGLIETLVSRHKNKK